MSDNGSDHARRLRLEFDQTFAAPLARAGAVENLLIITIGDQSYAVRVAEIAGLLADRKIVPVPTADPLFLGLIGYRSSLIPVFDLAAILNLATPPDPPRWILLARSAELLRGFAVQQFHQQIQLPVAELIAVEGKDRTTKYIGHLARTGDSVRPVLSISALLETTTSATSIEKER